MTLNIRKVASKQNLASLRFRRGVSWLHEHIVCLIQVTQDRVRFFQDCDSWPGQILIL